MEVVVGFILNKGKVLLIKHKKKNMWLPVGGHVEKGEDLKEALKREIWEEVNLEVKIADKPFFTLKEPNETTYHYICNYKSGIPNINKNELLDASWFTKEEIELGNFDKLIKELVMKIFS